jgi:uncharacterized protein (DUF2235 family)
VAKNIVVCCDGTANEFKRDRTNVVKLFRTLVKDPGVQACYYHPGVGTMAAPGFVTKTGALAAEIAGMAFGYGLTDDICDAYIFICRHFEPQDKLYLFGFSRGAYTARALASMLSMYGLAPRDNERLVPYAVRMMWAINHLRRRAKPGAPPDARVDEYFALAAAFKETFSRPSQPHFVGVWDTVSSVGWLTNPVSLPYTGNNPDIAIGRHAVAIDERRAFFRTNLWRRATEQSRTGPKDMKQVWFPGVHSDVGGGYPEPESGLSKIALQWMVDEARQAGLVLDTNAVDLILGRLGRGYAPPNPDAPLHNSLTRWWRPIEWVPKPHWNQHLGKSVMAGDHGAHFITLGPRPCSVGNASNRGNDEGVGRKNELGCEPDLCRRRRHPDETPAALAFEGQRIVGAQRQHSMPSLRRRDQGQRAILADLPAK